MTDDEGRYLAANDSGLTLLGYTREELGRDQRPRRERTRSDEEIAEVYAMLKRKHSVQHRARFRRKDGVIGSIEAVSLASKVGGLPVVVLVTAPIVATFSGPTRASPPRRSSSTAIVGRSTARTRLPGVAARRLAGERAPARRRPCPRR